MKKYLKLLTILLLLTACNNNALNTLSVKGKIYKHPTAVQYLKFKTDSVQYYGNFGNETLNNKAFAYTQKDEVVTVFAPAPEHLLAYEGFVLRGDTIYEQVADTSDPNYQDHQPTDPTTWSPVGKRYISTDINYPNEQLHFLTANTIDIGIYGTDTRLRAYRLEYPYIYLNTNSFASFYFVDTLSIGRFSSQSDFPATYQWVSY